MIAEPMTAPATAKVVKPRKTSKANAQRERRSFGLRRARYRCTRAVCAWALPGTSVEVSMRGISLPATVGGFPKYVEGKGRPREDLERVRAPRRGTRAGGKVRLRNAYEAAKMNAGV